MKTEVNQLITDMIRTERTGRIRHADRALREIREQSSMKGILHSTVHGHLLDRASAEEYELRGNSWLQLVRRVAEEIPIPWTPALAQDLEHLIKQELGLDWQEIYGRLKQESDVLTRVGGARMQELDATKHRMDRRIEQELNLLVLKQDRALLPLSEKLSADRYRAVAVAWQKANQHLESTPPDYGAAAKEAVASVEALARIVVGDSSCTLGDAIKSLRNRGRIDAPLLKGIEELWGWASNEPSVRHGSSATSVDPTRARYSLKLAEAALDLLLANDTV